MTSLIAIVLLGLLVVSGVAFLVARRVDRGGRRGRFASLPAVLAVLVAVLGAWLAGWLIALVLADR